MPTVIRGRAINESSHMNAMVPYARTKEQFEKNTGIRSDPKPLSLSTLERIKRIIYSFSGNNGTNGIFNRGNEQKKRIASGQRII